MNWAARSEDAQGYLDQCGSALEAVRGVVCLGRALWRIHATPDLLEAVVANLSDESGVFHSEEGLRGVVEKEFYKSRHSEVDASFELKYRALIDLLGKYNHVAPVMREGSPPLRLVKVKPSLYHPSSVCDDLLAPVLGRAQTLYWLRHEKRVRFRLALSPFVVRAFHLFSTILNKKLRALMDAEVGQALVVDTDSSGIVLAAPRPRAPSRRERVWSRAEIYDELRQALEEDTNSGDRFLSAKEEATPHRAVSDVTTAFIETALMVRAMTVARQRMPGGAFEIRAEQFDAEYLIGHLYGLPTSIKGLDVLFGGGGIVLAEDVEGASSDHVTGRVIFVRGRAGLGKSLLSLQLALEVAKKGGVAWVSPLEQSPVDSLHSLEATFHRDMRGVKVLVGVSGATRLDSVRKQQKGALVLVPTIKSSVADFLTSLVETAERLTDFPLKLLVADPINSVRHSGSDLHDMRRRFVEALDRIKALRVNLVLVGEDDEHGQSDELDFLEKICDTAIRLSIESSNLYSRKFFEIRKSRLQREQRGAHPYSIVSGEGYVIQPSTAAVASRIRNRRTSPKDTSNRFGIAGIDSILGRTALASGDVIVLSGSQGCWRREIGMAFLLSKEGDPRQVRSERHRVPLFLSFGRSVESLQAMLSEDHVWYLSRGKGAKRPDEVRVLGVLPGYTNPGSVFQRLEEKLDDIRRAGLSLDRVLVDGISSLEGMFPLLSSDVAFPGTLVEFFRRQRVTAAYVIGSEPRSRPASVESVITESADVLITLRRPNARNSSVEGQVTKAHGAGYKRDWFGVDFVPGRGFIVDMRQ